MYCRGDEQPGAWVKIEDPKTTNGESMRYVEVELEEVLLHCEAKAKQCKDDGDGESVNSSQSLYGQADAYRDIAKRLRVILSKPPLCDHCGAKAMCRGSYEGSPIMFGCDECCGHGNEDGACVKLQGAS